MANNATVSHPSHYTQGDIECIDAIRASMSKEEFKGYLKGNVEKYMWRYRHKNGAQDLEKAQWYLARLIESMSQDSQDENDRSLSTTLMSFKCQHCGKGNLCEARFRFSKLDIDELCNREPPMTASPLQHTFGSERFR